MRFASTRCGFTTGCGGSSPRGPAPKSDSRVATGSAAAAAPPPGGGWGMGAVAAAALVFRAGWRRLPAARPVAEERLQRGHGLGRVDVARDDDGGVVRDEVPRGKVARVIEGDARDRLRIAADRVAVRAGAVEQAGEALRGDGGGLVAQRFSGLLYGTGAYGN